MATVTRKAPDGTLVSFIINGDEETPEEKARIASIMAEKFPGQHGLTGGFSRGLGRGLRTWANAPETARAASGDIEAIKNIGQEGKTNQYEESGAPNFSEAIDDFLAGSLTSGVKKFGSAFLDKVGEFAGTMASQAAPGAAATAAFGPGAGVGALAGIGVGSALDTTREGIRRQLEAGIAPENVSGGKAVGIGALVGAANLIPPGRLFRGASSAAVDGMTNAALEGALARGTTRNLVGAVGREAAEQAALQGALAPGTEAAMRAQSGQDLMSPEALEAYKRSAVEGALTGASIGAPFGVLHTNDRRNAARNEINRRNAATPDVTTNPDTVIPPTNPGDPLAEFGPELQPMPKGGSKYPITNENYDVPEGVLDQNDADVRRRIIEQARMREMANQNNRGNPFAEYGTIDPSTLHDPLNEYGRPVNGMSGITDPYGEYGPDITRDTTFSGSKYPTNNFNYDVPENVLDSAPSRVYSDPRLAYGPHQESTVPNFPNDNMRNRGAWPDPLDPTWWRDPMAENMGGSEEGYKITPPARPPVAQGAPTSAVEALGLLKSRLGKDIPPQAMESFINKWNAATSDAERGNLFRGFAELFTEKEKTETPRRFGDYFEESRRVPQEGTTADEALKILKDRLNIDVLPPTAEIAFKRRFNEAQDEIGRGQVFREFAKILSEKERPPTDVTPQPPVVQPSERMLPGVSPVAVRALQNRISEITNKMSTREAVNTLQSLKGRQTNESMRALVQNAIDGINSDNGVRLSTRTNPESPVVPINPNSGIAKTIARIKKEYKNPTDISAALKREAGNSKYSRLPGVQKILRDAASNIDRSVVATPESNALAQIIAVNRTMTPQRRTEMEDAMKLMWRRAKESGVKNLDQNALVAKVMQANARRPQDDMLSIVQRAMFNLPDPPPDVPPSGGGVKNPKNGGNANTPSNKSVRMPGEGGTTSLSDRKIDRFYKPMMQIATAAGKDGKFSSFEEASNVLKGLHDRGKFNPKDPVNVYIANQFTPYKDRRVTINPSLFQNRDYKIKTFMNGLDFNILGKEYSNLASTLKSLVGDVTIRAGDGKKFRDKEGSIVTAGYFDYPKFVGDRPTVHLNDNIQSFKTERILQTLLHEAVHASVDAKLVHDDRLFLYAANLTDFASNKLLKHNPQWKYALSNPHEFFAYAFTDPNFRRYLEAVKIPKNQLEYYLPPEKRTIWGAVVDFVRRIFGLPDNPNSYNVFDAAMRLGSHLLSNTKESTEIYNNSAKLSGHSRENPFSIGDLWEDQGYTPKQISSMTPVDRDGIHKPASEGLMEGAKKDARRPFGGRVSKLSTEQARDAQNRFTNMETTKWLEDMLGKLPFVTEQGAKKGAMWWTRNIIDEHASLDDMVHRMLKVQREMNGGELTPIEDDPYHLGRTMQARVAHQNNEFKVNFFEPINKTVQEISARTGVTPEKIIENADDYIGLFAEKERNAYFEKKGIADGSGKSDALIDEQMKAYENDPMKKDYERIRSLYKNIVEYINDTRVKGDLIPKDLEGIGPDYMPLRDREWRAMDEDAPTGLGLGGGLAPLAREDMRAKGRIYESGDFILKNLINMAMDANRRVESNKITQAAYRMLSMPNMEGFGYAFPPGVVPERRDGRIVRVKFGGKDSYMRFTNGKVADIFNKSPLSIRGGDDVHVMLRNLSKISDFVRKTVTIWSPEFMLSNQIRDMLEVALKGRATDVKSIATKTAKGVPEAMQMIRKMEKARADGVKFIPKTDAEKRALLFLEQGAPTDSWGNRDEHTDRMFDEAFKNQNKRTPLTILRAIDNKMEQLNHVVENGTRLAAFNALMNEGYSASSAAAFARTVTVDFSQKGALSPALNAGWLFWNAGTQGTVGLFNAALRPGEAGLRVRRILAGAVGAGMAQAMLGYYAAGTNDAGESNWLSITPWERHNNFMIPKADGGYYKIPMPHGFQAIHSFGQQIAEILISPPKNQAEISNAIMSGFGDILEQVLPFGSTQSWVNYISPTIARPIVQLATGKTGLGQQVDPDQSGGVGRALAPSQNFWNNANPVYVKFADLLHQYTGGGLSKHETGLVEISPGQISLIVESLTGGAGTFLGRVMAKVGDETGIMQPDPRVNQNDVSNTPLVRRFYGEVGDKQIQSRFIDMEKFLLPIGREFEEARVANTPDKIARLQEVYAKHPNEIKAYMAIKPILDMRHRLTQQMNHIMSIPIDPAQQRDTVTRMRQQVNTLTAQALAVYNKISAD